MKLCIVQVLSYQVIKKATYTLSCVSLWTKIHRLASDLSFYITALSEKLYIIKGGCGAAR
jgi:hypothetical protein